GVPDTEAAAEVDLGQIDAVFGHDLGAEAQHPGGGDLEAGDVEDLRADVRVEAVEAQMGGVGDLLRSACRGSVGQGQAELLVFVGGGDEVVGVCLDAHGHSQHDRGQDSPGPGDRVEPVDLVEAVDEDPPDPVVEGVFEFGDRLVVPVQAHPVAGDPGGASDHHLPQRAGVEAETGLVHPAGHRGAQE